MLPIALEDNLVGIVPLAQLPFGLPRLTVLFVITVPRIDQPRVWYGLIRGAETVTQRAKGPLPIGIRCYVDLVSSGIHDKLGLTRGLIICNPRYPAGSGSTYLQRPIAAHDHIAKGRTARIPHLNKDIMIPHAATVFIDMQHARFDNRKLGIGLSLRFGCVCRWGWWFGCI
jgi:hypothetical protein